MGLIGRFKGYLREVKAEMKRVSWVEKKLLWVSTFLVIIVSVISAFYIGVVDLLVSKIVALIIR
ncbi:MAG: preprotein translocase subunit SecE [Caldiserica bacterium]|nr:preprotein translocase subunit SecE [Caldisericota bacterium]